MPLSLAGTSGGTIAMSYSILWTYFAWTRPPQLRRQQAQPQRHRQQALPPRRQHQARMGSRLLKRGYELLFAFIFLSRIFEKSFVRYVSEPWVGHRVFLGWPLHPLRAAPQTPVRHLRLAVGVGVKAALWSWCPPLCYNRFHHKKRKGKLAFCFVMLDSSGSIDEQSRL